MNCKIINMKAIIDIVSIDRYKTKSALVGNNRVSGNRHILIKSSLLYTGIEDVYNNFKNIKYEI